MKRYEHGILAIDRTSIQRTNLLVIPGGLPPQALDRLVCFAHYSRELWTKMNAQRLGVNLPYWKIIIIIIRLSILGKGRHRPPDHHFLQVIPRIIFFDDEEVRADWTPEMNPLLA